MECGQVAAPGLLQCQITWPLLNQPRLGPGPRVHHARGLQPQRGIDQGRPENAFLSLILTRSEPLALRAKLLVVTLRARMCLPVVRRAMVMRSTFNQSSWEGAEDGNQKWSFQCEIQSQVVDDEGECMIWEMKILICNEVCNNQIKPSSKAIPNNLFNPSLVLLLLVLQYVVNHTSVWVWTSESTLGLIPWFS